VLIWLDAGTRKKSGEGSRANRGEMGCFGEGQISAHSPVGERKDSQNHRGGGDEGKMAERKKVKKPWHSPVHEEPRKVISGIPILARPP